MTRSISFYGSFFVVNTASRLTSFQNLFKTYRVLVLLCLYLRGRALLLGNKQARGRDAAEQRRVERMDRYAPFQQEAYVY